jgi:hypothetical protein
MADMPFYQLVNSFGTPPKYLSISFFIAPSWQFVEEEQGNVKLLLVKYLSSIPSPKMR